jgi:hypothetical protein
MLFTYLAAAAIFLLAVVGLAIGMIVGRRQLQCSCRGTERIMGEDADDPCPQAKTCARRLVDDTRRVQIPAGRPEGEA